MSAPSILVTGATGFTGGHLARRLARDGKAVRALVRDPARAAELAAEGIELAKGDLRDPAALKQAMAGIDTVYHIAATYRQEGIDPQEFWDINATGTENVLNAATESGVRRLVHCSTVGVHGEIEHIPADEQAPYQPGDNYQDSKLEGEEIAKRHMALGKIGISIFRPAGIYGPGDMRFLKLFKAIHRRRFFMIGSGELAYHFTYIDDLVDGIILCGTRDEAVGQIYILAGERYLSLNQVVAMIAEELGVAQSRLRVPVWPVYVASYLCEILCKPLRIEPPLYRRRLDFFRKARAFDISKARRDLGYDPKIPLSEGIRRTARWYREKGHI